MKIIISGVPGSGKSTTAKLLAKKLNYKHYSMGDFQREIAKEKGLTIIELSKLEEKDKTIDKMVDEKQTKLGIKEDNFVLDSRLGAKFIPDADFKIFVDCKFDERAKRIYEHSRKDESGTLSQIKKQMKERENIEKKRFKEFYKFDYTDKKHYDIIVDTTEMKKGEVINTILEIFNESKH